jgi:capsular polysaccharide transport system permease protein
MSETTASFAASLRIQIRVISALLMREILTRYGRHNIGFLWLFLEPVLFTLGVTALWASTRHLHDSTLPVVPFVVTGYSTILLWRNCSNRSIQAITANASLLYHRNVKLLDVFLARNLLEIVGASSSFTLIWLAMISVGLMQWPADALILLSGWLLLAWFSIGLSIIIGCLSEIFEAVERVWHTITYLMLPLSGAFFFVEWLPVKWRSTALLIPMVNCTEMIRDGYFGASVKTHFDIAYLVVVCMSMSLVGIILLRRASRKVEAA